MAMPQIFVLDVPEFSALVAQARTRAGCQVAGPRLGYWRIRSDQPLEFRRKELGFKPAVWHGALTGGLVGRITHFDNDLLRIEEDITPNPAFARAPEGVPSPLGQPGGRSS